MEPAPRCGVPDHPQTTLHAGYARYFTPPPNELISGQTIAFSQGTTSAPPGTQNDAVQSESSDYYDLGISHQLTPHVTLGLDGYYKQLKNLLDEGQFGSALLYTPFNYREGKIYGTELTVNYRKDDFSAYFNLARSTALGNDITSAQYNFDAAELAYIANNWVHLDHDQRITASLGGAYRWRGTTWSADAIYGSGLRNGFANTGHLPGYTQVNVGASRKPSTSRNWASSKAASACSTCSTKATKSAMAAASASAQRNTGRAVPCMSASTNCFD